MEISHRIDPITILVNSELILSQKEGENAQIDNIPFIYQQESNIAGLEIIKPYESVRNLSIFPTNTVILNITGQVYTTSEMNNNTGLSFTNFKSSKFEVNGSKKKDWYARKNYNSQVMFKLI